MPDTAPSPPPLLTARAEDIFPKLSHALMTRLASHGRARQFSACKSAITMACVSSGGYVGARD